MSKSKNDKYILNLDDDIIEKIDLENDPYYIKHQPDVVSLGEITVDSIDFDSNFTMNDTLYVTDASDSITITTEDTYNRWGTYASSDTVTFPWDNNKVWRHCMPSLHEVEEMCKEYPALEKAFENFKTIYKMVEQDYKGKKEDDT